MSLKIAMVATQYMGLRDPEMTQYATNAMLATSLNEV